MKPLTRPPLDVELAIIESMLPESPPLDKATFPHALREHVQTLPRPDMPSIEGISIKDIRVDTACGVLGLRIISPDSPRAGRSCMFWIHGGGYIMGSAFQPDPRLMEWVELLDCVLVSVDYGLAPEYQYPAPLEHCYAGLQWTAANADSLGFDPEKLAIAGISAGAGLCAALAILARNRGEITPCFQLLIYPMIDDRGITGSSQFDDAPIWFREINELSWDSYLGDDHLRADLPITAAPARATVEQLKGLPPTFINVGTCDIFCDENIAYATALLAAGVPTELHVYAGGFHGFDALMAHTKIAQTFNRDVDEALIRVLGR